MVFAPADSRRLADEMFADMVRTLRKRDPKKPEETLEAMSTHMRLTALVLQNTKRPVKKRNSKKRKECPTDESEQRSES